jgi:polyferredoxin
MITAKYHNKRRLVQLLSLAVFILIPVFGLFRIDVDTGDFTVLNRQVWWSDYFLMLGTTITLIALAIMSYSTVGAVWCGWACPQNTVSEWANNLTRRFLGKRAELTLNGEVQIAESKNKLINWLILAASFLGVSLVLGIVPFFYFYPPEVVWSLITFSLDPKLSEFMSRLYMVFVIGIFIDIALIRYFLCDYACMYRLGYRFFKNKEALHIDYDASRSSECSKCNYCATSCIVSIDPTNFKPADTCINCAECVDACNRLHERKGSPLPGLLKYGAGSATGVGKVTSLLRRFNWVSVIFAIGVAMTAWGFYSYQPYDIVAYRAERATAAAVSDYRVRISSKLYTPSHITLKATGLPEGSYRFDSEQVTLGPAERANVYLHISPDLAKGLYRVNIEAKSDDGWTGRFQVTHFSEHK